MAKTSPFDYVKYINRSEPEPENIEDLIDESYSQFMINRILSSNSKLLGFCVQMNRIIISDYSHYKACKNAYKEKFIDGVSHYRTVYFSYAKEEKIPMDIKEIQEYFGVNEATAKEYDLLISDEERAKVKKIYEWNHREEKKK